MFKRKLKENDTAAEFQRDDAKNVVRTRFQGQKQDERGKKPRGSFLEKVNKSNVQQTQPASD